MITRTCEATVLSGLIDQFLEFLAAAVSRFPSRYPGLLDQEILVDAGSVLYVSRWRSEADLVEYAGAHWREQPVVLPDEGRFLAKPLVVRHFTSYGLTKI
nr:hypothetical protein [Kibdelosporangium sp. MJ126-NF4]CEL20006.1 hypothetical protein [Kibdelosporangium sp. MJ126-NF4]CTQ97230.1 hypothetical protein [Kibdelosporangium sp. MJ126-NF4]